MMAAHRICVKRAVGSMGNQRGYTLIEILVVLFIISIVSSLTLVSIGRNEHKQLEAFANTLTQTITLAEDFAMLQPAIIGLSFNGHIFQFYAYQPNSKIMWLPLQEKGLDKKSIPVHSQISILVAGHLYKQDENSVTMSGPPIIISTNGDLTPFTILLGKEGAKPRYAIIGNADGSITQQLMA